MNKQESSETIERHPNLFTDRIIVPGGWIYRSFIKSNQSMGMVFVPNPETVAVELLEAAKACYQMMEREIPGSANAFMLKSAIDKAEGR